MTPNQRHHRDNLTRRRQRPIRGDRLRELISEGARTPPMRSTVSDQSNTSNGELEDRAWSIDHPA
jgi:hypothetical protein